MIATQVGSFFGILNKSYKEASETLLDFLPRERLFADIERSVRQLSAEIYITSKGKHIFLQTDAIQLERMPLSWAKVLNSGLFSHHRSHLERKIFESSPVQLKAYENEVKSMLSGYLKQFDHHPMTESSAKALYESLLNFFEPRQIPSFDKIFIVETI